MSKRIHPRGHPDVVQRAAMLHTDNQWRAHPINYDDAAYRWREPPIACASCHTRAIGPYRVIRADSGQNLLLHETCGNAMLHRLSQ